VVSASTASEAVREPEFGIVSFPGERIAGCTTACAVGPGNLAAVEASGPPLDRRRSGGCATGCERGRRPQTAPRDALYGFHEKPSLLGFREGREDIPPFASSARNLRILSGAAVSVLEVVTFI